MSWHYSRELVEAYWEAIYSDGDASVPSKSTATPDEYSSHGRTTDASRRSQSGTTSERLTDDHGEALLTWYREGSRVRTSAARAEGLASLEPSQGSGAKWRALSVRFDPATSGWRTPHDLFNEGSKLSLPTLPRWGLMRSGELWGRLMPGLRTGGNVSGSRQATYPTPTTLDCAGARRMNPSGNVRKWGGVNSLGGMAATGMWPKTTTAGPDFAKVNRSKAGISLQTAVEMWPPVQDAKNNGGESQYQRNSLPLNAIVGGSLNPTWVEWLMGWPLGWTDCDASATVRFRQWLRSHGKH